MANNICSIKIVKQRNPACIIVEFYIHINDISNDTGNDGIWMPFEVFG